MKGGLRYFSSSAFWKQEALKFYMIIKEGGFALLFEYQIYDLSQVELVNKITEIMNYPAAELPGIKRNFY